MENNEFNNNEENKIEEAVVQEPNKSKKKTAIILVIGLVTFTIVVAVGITVFWIKSFDGTSKTGHTESPFSTNTIDDTDDKSNESNSNTTSNYSDTGSYVVDSEIKDLANFIYFAFPESGKNILDESEQRLLYLELVLMANGKSSFTKDDLQYGQSLQTISYNDFADEFNSIYGNNYDLTQTITDLGNNYAIFNRCESKPSVNDGNHVCWIGPSTSTDEYRFYIFNRNNNGSTYVIDGNYKQGNETGTFLFTYTVSGNKKYLKSVVLTKTN